MPVLSAKKISVILLASLTVLALAELASGLRDISFHEAQAFGQKAAQSARTNPIDLVTAVMDIPLKTQLTIWVLFVLMFAFIGMLMSPEMRKRLLKIAIRVAVTYWALWILFDRYRDVLAEIGLRLTPAGGDSSLTTSSAPVPEFTPPQAISWVAYLLSFAIVVAVILVIWKLNSIWQELNAPVPTASLKKIAGIARNSLRDLSAGQNSSDVIMNCYYRMSDLVLDKKHLDRGASMTPSEFAAQLEQAGLPSDAVRRLTRLFEAVRYGARQSDPAAVNEAVACLTTIVHYCGETV